MINNFINYWKKEPFLMKIYLIISTFIASSSIASMSEAVFKWKNFILDGVNFYNQYILNIIKPIFKLLPNISDMSINTFIIGIIYLSGLSKVILKSDKYKFLSSKIFWIQFFYVFYIIGFIEMYEYPIYWLSATSLVIIMTPFLIKDFTKTSSQTSKAVFIVYSTILIPIAFVLILAAINTGLSK